MCVSVHTHTHTHTHTHLVLGARLLLIQAHSADGRVAEDGGGHVRVVRLAGLASEESVGEAVPLGQRDRRELRTNKCCMIKLKILS